MYAIIKIPKFNNKKSHIKMLPEVYDSIEKAENTINEYNNRSFLIHYTLKIVNIEEVKV